MSKHALRQLTSLAVLGLGVVALVPVSDASPAGQGSDARSVAAYWSADRIAAAIPRDIVVDEHGRSQMLGADGRLHAYGLDKVVALQVQKGKPSGGGGSLSNVVWSKGGAVKVAAGRLFFVMDATGWVCSGTTVTDGNTGISLILTAAHCVYDDANKAFASSALFIPDLASSGTRTSSACSADYTYGCWVPEYGVVGNGWSDAVWPDNIPYDYGLYVVQNSGSHQYGSGGANLALDSLGALAASWTGAVENGTLTDAIGYTYKYDPQLMYCEQGMGRVLGTATYSQYWLSACKLGGGSSGGPWMAASGNGAGPVVSVNSWGYQGKPGMAGPVLQAAAPKCVFDVARANPVPTSGGVEVNCT